MARFTDKVAVISGGNQPNSLAMAKKFSSEGAKVAILTKDAAADTAAFAEAGAKAYACNIAKFDEVTAAFDKIKAELGPVDILVCNPNASCPKTLLETTPAEWNEVLGVNVHSMFYCCKQVFADMKERKTGEVILFSDNAANGVAGNAAFAITSASALGLIGSCSRETEKYGVTCNCVTPTPGATPEEVADTVALLASEEGRALQGQSVKVIKNWTRV